MKQLNHGKRSLVTTLILLIFITVMNAETNYPEKILTTKDGSRINITLFKHASLSLEYDGIEIYVDPVTKVGDTTIDYTELPKADYILVTHEHYDHLDPKAIEELSKPGTQIILNETSEKQLGKGTVMANNESMNLKDGIVLESVPAYNTTPGREKFHPKGNGNGYILNFDGTRIYIAGDTEDIPEMSQIKNIDLAFLPVNQPYTMTIDQAEKAALTIKPKILIPYHFSDTPIKELKDRLDKDKSGIDVELYPME
ncbi:MAG: MBL fold metallo-hydrolase [Muribaculaceae bacterium]|nr:MBL fold metallo-hydrolase [Muribaculaceae bacterium]